MAYDHYLAMAWPWHGLAMAAGAGAQLGSQGCLSHMSWGPEVSQSHPLAFARPWRGQSMVIITSSPNNENIENRLLWISSQWVIWEFFNHDFSSREMQRNKNTHQDKTNKYQTHTISSKLQEVLWVPMGSSGIFRRCGTSIAARDMHWLRLRFFGYEAAQFEGLSDPFWKTF